MRMPPRTATAALALCAEPVLAQEPLGIGISFQEPKHPHFARMRQALEEVAASIGAEGIATDAGHAILMISSGLPEVIGMSDRVCVFRSDGITATLEGDAVNSEDILIKATTGPLNMSHAFPSRNPAASPSGRC